jgi:hypothetical protein
MISETELRHVNSAASKNAERDAVRFERVYISSEVLLFDRRTREGGVE